jgi:hypothetical protein
MHQDALFGELRSIMQRPASEETWSALCDHLDLWAPDASAAIAEPYASDIIARWPSYLSLDAPPRWAERAAREGRAGPLWAWVSSVAAHGAISCTALACALRDATHARRLRQLILGGEPLDEEGLAALCGAQHLASVEWLSLFHCALGERGARMLAGSPMVRGIYSLNLFGCALGEAEVRALGSASWSARLGLLSLGKCGLDAAAVRHIAPLCGPRLHALDLNQNWFGDEGAMWLSDMPTLTSLRSLHLGSCDLSDEGAMWLADAPALANLHALDLSNNARITRTGAAALAASPHLPESIRARWRAL